MSLKTPYYPGIDYNADKGPEMNAVAIAFIALSLVSVVLRFTSRLYTRVSLWLDDWLIVAAAVLSWAYSALVIAAVQDAFYGQHIGHSNPAAAELFGKQLYALAIIYPPALVLSKLSLIALYWRIFSVAKTARMAMITGASLNVAWGIAAFLVGIFSCWPIAANWNPMIPHKCIDYPPFFLSNEAITITLDLVVLLMPLFWISKIKRSFTERLSLIVTFSLGLVATIVSALRLWRLVVADRLPTSDPTYTESDAALWAIIELNLWVLVASIPALRPAAAKIWKRTKRDSTTTPIAFAGGPDTIYTNSAHASYTKRSWVKPWRSAGSSASHSSGARSASDTATLTKDSPALASVAAGGRPGGPGLGVAAAERGNPFAGETVGRASGGEEFDSVEHARGDEVWLGNLGSVRVERSLEVTPQRAG